ncbi:MAG: NAD(P)-dependent oxidoreductase [Verrucomicrobia bacterium]|nr:NAD(P)-dependent oxidoreductase [Verrucomicrobiota bacterium]
MGHHTRERILLTGAAGRIGSVIVPLLRQYYALRLLDLAPLTPERDDHIVRCDLRNFVALKRACKGVRALVHLAAVSDEADFHSKLLPMNLEGAYNAFEAARQAGLRKVVFASTAQTVLNYGKGHWVTPEMPPRPFTVYACTKVFGEALARYYADTHGMSVIVLRICYFRSYDDPLLRVPGHDVQREWVSPKDLTHLLVKCLKKDISYGLFFAVSNNTGRYWDIRNAQEILGYNPQDNAVDMLKVPLPEAGPAPEPEPCAAPPLPPPSSPEPA